MAWTLAIEVQFYIVSGLCMGFMPRESPKRTALILAVLAASGAVITDERYVFHYLPFFALGWSGAFVTNHKDSFLPWCSAAFAAAVVLWITNWLQVGLALSALAVILFWKWAIPQWMLALGTISYSLYLLHVSIGGRVVNLGLRFAEARTLEVVPVIAAGLLLSLVISAVFWRYVELPAQRWSRTLFPKN